MKLQSKLLSFSLILILSVSPAFSNSAVLVQRLQCEYRINPLGIDIVKPRLSWVLESGQRGQKQSAYQVLVSSSEEKLNDDQGDLWDSGKIESNQTIQVVYGGSALKSRMRCYWKVRVWDKNGELSDWSKPAMWSMGLLCPSDWQASWISDPTTLGKPIDPGQPYHGYLSQIGNKQDEKKWIVIDLGRIAEVDGVKLFPAHPHTLHPYTTYRDIPGYLFPLRFRIELASENDFPDAKTVVDKTQADVPNPVNTPQIYPFPKTAARYVRLTVTRLRDHGDKKYGLALAEMEVLSGEKNLALGAVVSVSDPPVIDGGEWYKTNLVDGRVDSKIAKDIPPQQNPAIMVRKEFSVSKPIKRATVYVTGLGLYELRVNGHKVGKDIHVPDWTSYLKRIQYQTYDVGNLLVRGGNALGIILGEGRYAGRIQMWPPRPYLYGSYPKLLLRLEIELMDGSTQIIVTDSSWRSTTEGPIRFSGIYEGEVYDALKEMLGWDASGFDDSSWRPVSMEKDLGQAKLVWQRNQPIQVIKELKPVKLTQPRTNVFVFDLGQNIAGWCRLRIQGKEGTTVVLKHGEMLNEDGTVYVSNLHAGHWSDAPAQTDTFILRGHGQEVFEPHFTYHGFRYVELTGLPAGSLTPTLDSITGCAFHSACPDAGEFECSSPMLNQLIHNIVWSQRGNLLGVPTDCPNRDERMGFTGDMQTFSQAAIFNMDMAAFFSKWIEDLRDDQDYDGRYPEFAPNPDTRRSMAGAAWSDAGVIIPWRMYQNYGDKRMLEEHFESAKRWVDFVHKTSENFISILDTAGDWLNADAQRYEGWPETGGEIPYSVFATAFFAHVTEILSKMAAVIGRNEEAKFYHNLFEQIKASFNHRFVGPFGKIEGDTQAGYALALHFNLLHEELRPKAINYMIEGFRRYNGHLSTGIQASHRLMLELTRFGRNDEAYRLLNLRTPPSWAYMIDQGATTIWERWDGYVKGRGFAHSGMNSFNHFAFGAVGEWMWRTIVGLNPDEDIPAYKHFIIHPRPGGGLTWAKGEYDSIQGKIVSEWKIKEGRFHLTITVPSNTTATVFVPTVNLKQVWEGNNLAEKSEGVKFLRMEEGAAVFEVGSGRYVFKSDYKVAD